jgi:GMP synthase-like glutamine amidotransferase
MKPVAIFRHAPTEGPGYFAEYLDRQAIAWRLVEIDRGEPVPTKVNDFSGLAFMGGPMSVNDELPWIAPVLSLIRCAVQVEIPVIGHCLGGQLMARALGGSVGANPVKEIGWGEVSVARHALAREWLGETRSFNSFHWHGETFSLPPGATHIAASRYCENQMFVLGQRHLGMQCHIEMTPELIESWCATGAGEIAACVSPAVMEVESIKLELNQRLEALHKVADRVYARWIQGLRVNRESAAR